MAMGETELVRWELRGVTMPGNVVRVELGERGACECVDTGLAYDAAVAAHKAAVACGWTSVRSFASSVSPADYGSAARVALPADASVEWPPGITAKVVDGRAATKPAKRDVVLRDGMRFTTPCGTVHTLRCRGEDRWEATWVHDDTQFLGGTFSAAHWTDYMARHATIIDDAPGATKSAAEPRGVLIIGTKPEPAADFTVAEANRIDPLYVAKAEGFTPPDPKRDTEPSGAPGLPRISTERRNAMLDAAFGVSANASAPPSRDDILREAIADVPDGVTRDAWRAFCAYAVENYAEPDAEMFEDWRADLAQYERIRAALLRGGRVG